MIKFKLPNKVTKTAGMLMLKAKAYTPEIFVISGFGLGVASLITVGVKTWKHKDKLAADKKKVDEARELKRHKETIVTEDGTSKEVVVKKSLNKEEKKQYLGAYIDLTLDSIKTYILPVGEAVLAGVLIWKGRGILRGRLSMATAQVAALTEMNRQLMKQIEEKNGGSGENDDNSTAPFDIDEEGRVVKDNLPHTFSFVFGPGIWNKEAGEWYHKNYEWSRSKIDNQYKAKSIQDWARRTVNTTRAWVSYGEIVDKFGCPTEPWMYNWAIWSDDGSDIYIDFHVFESDQQLEVNKRFLDPDDPTNVCVIQLDGMRCLDIIVANPEKYDKRFGIRPKKMPTVDEMVSADYTKELAKGGCPV